MASPSVASLDRGQPALVGSIPFYGMLADVRMFWLATTGRLRGEYLRLGLGEPTPIEGPAARPL
jgi:hypothetical protein